MLLAINGAYALLGSNHVLISIIMTVEINGSTTAGHCGIYAAASTQVK
jgi:hypothetical protein